MFPLLLPPFFGETASFQAILGNAAAMASGCACGGCMHIENGRMRPVRKPG
jgi:hypothetical protein